MTPDELAAVVAIACAACAGACAWAAVSVRRAVRDAKDLAERLASLGDRAPENPLTAMLGRQVEARKYEASGWERGTVIAASWHGALRVRPNGEGTSAYWVPKERVPERVREVRCDRQS